eukprot:362235-Chlamydomonas_euryale.AAC.2
MDMLRPTRYGHVEVLPDMNMLRSTRYGHVGNLRNSLDYLSTAAFYCIAWHTLLQRCMRLVGATMRAVAP